jgi:hypothetical protein
MVGWAKQHKKAYLAAKAKNNFLFFPNRLLLNPVSKAA